MTYMIRKKNDMFDDEKNKDIVLGALKFVINNLKD